MAVYIRKDVYSLQRTCLFIMAKFGEWVLLCHKRRERESECSLGIPLCKEKLLRKSEEEPPNQQQPDVMLNANIKDEPLLSFDS